MRPRRALLLAPVACAALLTPAACAGDAGRSDPPDGAASATPGQRFPDVVEAVLVPEGGDRFTVEVTLSSPYDTPQRYADAWRVLAGDEELAVRELAHDHAGEQPFTRSLSGVEIPAGVSRVTVQGRDQVHGYGGQTVTVDVPGR